MINTLKIIPTLTKPNKQRKKEQPHHIGSTPSTKRPSFFTRKNPEEKNRDQKAQISFFLLPTSL